MRISKLIQELTAVMAQHGDIPVEVQDDGGNARGTVEEVIPVNVGSVGDTRWRASLVI